MHLVHITKKRTEIIAALILIFMLLQIIYIISSQSPVLDEQFYPGTGRYTVQHGDFSPFAYRFHPPLAYYINSFFLYFDNNPVWQNKPFNMSNIANSYEIDYYLFITRLPIAFTSLILGVFIFIWARKLYGDKAALFVLALFSFEPTILAHSSLATTDIVAATFIFIAMYVFWKFSSNKTIKYSIIAGLFLGLALLSKFTALLLIPITLFLFLYIFRSVRKNIRLIIIYYLISFIVIWAFYGFQMSTINNTVHSIEKSQDFINQTFSSNKNTIITLMDVPLPATSYFTAFGYNFYHKIVGHGAYLFGEYSSTGWIHYYILAFLIKSTIPLILFVLLFFTFALRKIKFDFYNEIFLLLPLFVLFVALSLLKLNIGLRHLLPMYPFMFVMLGKILHVKFSGSKKRLFYIVVILLILWSVVEALLILPYNISYFNEFVGGPKNGYLYLSDTDVDWGQWLKYVSSYTKEKNITVAYLSLPLPESYTNNYVKSYVREKCIPQNGIHIVGVFFLTLDKNCYGWLENYTHYDMVAYSVLIYNVTGVIA